MKPPLRPIPLTCCLRLYDEWLIPLREQLRGEYLAALDLLASLLEQAGRFSAAVVAAERRLHVDPANEAAYVRLMRLHLSQGDKQAALRTYQAALAALTEESEGLEPAPGPHLQELYRQVQAAGEYLPAQEARSRAVGADP